MKSEKLYKKMRMGALKKLNRDFSLAKKKPQKYEQEILREMSVIQNTYRHEPWAIELRRKLRF